MTRQRARCSYATSPLPLYHLQTPSHNFSSSVVNTTRIFLARRVSTWADVNRSIRSGEREREGATTCSEDFAFICIVGEREKDEKREKERKRTKETSSKAGESEEDGKEKRRELRGHLVVKMKAPPLVAAPFVRGRRNRPIDSCIYLWRRHDSAWPTTTLATADDS